MAYPFDPFNLSYPSPMGFDFKQIQPQPPTVQPSGIPLPPTGPELPIPNAPVSPPMGQRPFQPQLQGVPDQAPPFQTSGMGMGAGVDPQIEFIRKAMAAMPQPETRVSDAMWGMIQNQPQRPQRGLGRKILAGTAGAILGPGVAQEMMYGGYNADMADWQAKFDPLAKLALDERADNTNQRMINAGIIQGGLRATDILGDQAVANRGLDLREDDMRFKQLVEQWKINNPKLQLQIDADGRVFGVGPGGTTQDLGIRAMSPAQKLIIEHANALDLVEARAAAQMRVNAAKPPTFAPFIITGPGGTFGYSLNSRTGQPAPMTVDGQPVTNIMRPGTSKNMQGQPTNLEEIRRQASETLRLIDYVLDDKGNITPEASWAVGEGRIPGAIARIIPGSDTATANEAINTIQSRAVIDLIAEMKRQSQTGATGFGALNLRELVTLEQAANMIKTNVDPKIFAREMKIIQDRLRLIMVDPADDTVTQPGTATWGSQGSPTGTGATGTTKPTAEDLIKKYQK